MGGFLAQRYFFPQLNFALPFFIAAIFAVFGLIIIARYFRETLISPAITTKLSVYTNFKSIFTDKKILRISMILILIQFSWSTYYQFIAPVLKHNFNYNSTEIGLFMGFIAFWLALAAAFGIRILQKYFTLMENNSVCSLYHRHWLIGYFNNNLVAYLAITYFALALGNSNRHG